MSTSAIGNLPVVGYQDQELHNLAHHDLYTTKEKVQMIFKEILNNVLVLPIIATNKNLCILFIIKKIIESQQHMKRIKFRYIDNQ